MFADLNDPVLQPESIKAGLIPEITISEGLRIKLDEMFSQEEKAYSKIWGATSVVQTDKSYVLILSILVDTFISKISFPMQPGPEIGSISDA